MELTNIHMESRTLHDMVVDPDHADRTTSAEFEASVKRLKEDGHYKCWVCGGMDRLQVHHWIVEYMFQGLEDLNLVKDTAERLDIYGYGRLLQSKPLSSSEDVRCMMVLCQEHHTGVDHENNNTGTGIHDLTFPSFIIQRVARPGCNPVPQKGETWQQAMERIKTHEMKEVSE